VSCSLVQELTAGAGEGGTAGASSMKCDERSGRGDPSGRRCEARCGRAYEKTGEPVCEKSHERVWSAGAGEEELPERVRGIPRTW
jgi:hypothetical protein